MNEVIISAINSLRNDYENGSTTIAKNAIDIFTNVVNSYSYDIDKIRVIANNIISTKPDMAALRNIILLCLDKLEYMQKPYNFDNEAKDIKFLMDTNTNNVINNAINIIIKLLPTELSIITTSYSSTVIKLFIELKKRDHSIRVYALESIWKERSYADFIINSCKQEGIESYHIKKDELVSNINHFDFAVIGADSFFDDGSVINGIQSLFLAENCYGKIRFFVLAESFKNSTTPISTINNIADGFDFIPERLITEVIN